MLDGAAAATLAEQWAAQGDANRVLAGLPPLTPEVRAAIVAANLGWLTDLFATITANAVVTPFGVVPMANSGGPVTGTGTIT